MSEFTWQLPAAAPVVPAPTPDSTKLGHVTAALNRLPEQFRDKPNIAKFITAFVTKVQEIEDAGQQLLTLRSIENGRGHQLDVIGRIVNQPRDGRSDIDYKRYLRARVRANRSSGTVPDILRVATLVLGDTAAHLVMDLRGVAAYVLRVENLAIDANLAGVILLSFLHQITAGGIRPILESGSTDPASWFEWDVDGRGWDNGFWLDARDPVNPLV